MREQTARHRLIVGTARTLAECEGWDAVTTRRMATEIEYSQPVLYTHFASMEQIAGAVARPIPLDDYQDLRPARQAKNLTLATVTSTWVSPSSPSRDSNADANATTPSPATTANGSPPLDS